MTDITTRNPEELLPLPEATLRILLALAEGERHGYGIMQDVARRTGGRGRLGPGTLYGAIKRMLAEGLIEEVARRAASEQRRRYYRLTRLGRRVGAAEVERLAALVRVARVSRLVPERS